jgi:hypothetical protein
MDALCQGSFFLADRSLSTSSEPDMLLVVRLITFDDFSIQTGAGILIEPALFKQPDVVNVLNKLVDGKFRFTPKQESKFARAILAACIRHDYTKYMRYA